MIAETLGASRRTNSHLTIFQYVLISTKENSNPLEKKWGIGLFHKNQYNGTQFVKIFTINAVFTPNCKT